MDEREFRQSDVLADRANGNEEAIQAFSSCVLEPARRERLARSLKEMTEYRWLIKKEREGVREALEGARAAHELGFRNQVKHHILEVEDRFFFDLTNKAIVVANRAGLSLRPLAKLSKEPGSRFEIRGVPLRGLNVRWRFQSVEEYDRPIPARILKMARALLDAGFTWHGSFVGEPQVIQAPRTINPDPILAVSVGRWLLEVGRW